ncbi:MAG: hypothetical protein IPM23_20595 [Candidatus Melainabacteria bacterium]|nr:hypothetical protein [Candidatus Melainabacteria bacterium]
MLTRKIFLAVFIPAFTIAGLYFSSLAFAHIDSLPARLHLPWDYAYAVVVAFSDMGVAAGVASLVVASVILKLKFRVEARWFGKARQQE